MIGHQAIVTLSMTGMLVAISAVATAQTQRPQIPTATVNTLRTYSTQSSTLEGTEPKVQEGRLLPSGNSTGASETASGDIANDRETVRLLLENGVQLVQSPQGRGQQLGTFSEDDTVLGRKVEVQLPVGAPATQPVQTPSNK